MTQSRVTKEGLAPQTLHKKMVSSAHALLDGRVQHVA